MLGLRRLAVLLVVLAVPAGAAAKPGVNRRTCPADPAAVIADQCPCEAARNHGQYVSCVIRAAAALRKAGCSGDALLRVLRCAARSTCGRPNAVVCCLGGFGVARSAATCAAAGGTAAGRGSVCGVCRVASTTSSTTLTSTTATSTVTTSTTTSTTSTSTTTTTVAVGVHYGNDVEFPAPSAHAPDYLLGSPIVIPVPSTLTHLCVIAKGGGPDVMLALYTDNAGWPGGLVAATGGTLMAPGPMEIPVAPTLLAPGTYWMMGVYDTDASIGIDETEAGAPVRYVDHPFPAPLPNPFGPATPYSGQKFNYYVAVEP